MGALAKVAVRKHPASEILLMELTVHLHLLNELDGQAARRRKRF